MKHQPTAADTIVVVAPMDASEPWLALDERVRVLASPREALDRAARGDVLAVIAPPDVSANGTEPLLTTFAEQHPDVVRIVTARREDAGAAISVINQAGIFGFIELPVATGPAREILDRADEHARRTSRQAATITELRSALERLRAQIALVEGQSVADQASVDPATELWDRQHLIERMEDEANRLARYGTPFGAVMVELADDPPGFEVAAADLVRDFMRKVDVSARFEAGRFVIVCPNTDDAGVHRVPERLLEAFIRADLPGSPAGARPHILIGSVAFEEGPAAPDEVLARLMEAIGHARANGGSVHWGEQKIPGE